MRIGKTTPVLRIFDEAVRIETGDLEGLHAELQAKQYGYSRPGIEDTSWGTREMSIKDPFGNRLTFAAPAAD